MLGQQKVSVFWSPRGRRLRPARWHFYLFICYETMSNCSQNCWINWNSAALCFKGLFHIGVWTFARFVRPLLTSILCIWEICSPFIQSRFSPLAKKTKKQKNKNKSVTAPILNPTDDQKPDTFLALKKRNIILYQRISVVWLCSEKNPIHLRYSLVATLGHHNYKLRRPSTAREWFQKYD